MGLVRCFSLQVSKRTVSAGWGRMNPKQPHPEHPSARGLLHAEVQKPPAPEMVLKTQLKAWISPAAFLLNCPANTVFCSKNGHQNQAQPSHQKQRFLPPIRCRLGQKPNQCQETGNKSSTETPFGYYDSCRAVSFLTNYNKNVSCWVVSAGPCRRWSLQRRPLP